MNSTSIEGLIKTSLNTLQELGFKNGTIKRHRRHLFQLRDYMRSKEQVMYNESVGEKYLLEMLTEGNFNDYRLKVTRHSINLLADILNNAPVRKKRIPLRTYPMPGELGKHVQDFLKRFKIESRPSDHTMRMYMEALNHFTVRMQQDCKQQLTMY